LDRTTTSPPGLSRPTAASGGWRSVAARFLLADLLAALAAAALPWSTTGFTVLLGLWLLSLILLLPTLDVRAFLRLLGRPVCLLPLALFALAVAGTLWAESPWPDRLRNLSPVAKLLVIPFLLYHFQRSQRGSWVLMAFLGSCAVLMVMSWIVLFAPELKLAATKNAGVPIKNYIAQSQELALCMVALIPFVIALFRQRRYALAAAGSALMLGFLADMAFVVSARAAMIYVPVLLAVFAVVHLDARRAALLFVGMVVAVAAIWFTSPYVRARIADVASDFRDYQQNTVSPTGQRLEYWRKSLKFFAASPVIGHGTGSTRQLFERDAAGQTGLAAEVTRNPHNQTLNVAVQWGLIGIVALYAMWLAHLLLFRGGGPANWIGLLVVVQNVVSSLFNSHLFDFHEGWMYVMGVGVAGGMSLAARRRATEAVPPGTMAPA
jgi:O-antigen ligase